MDDLGHVNDSSGPEPAVVGEVKEKDYPTTEFCAEEMTSLKGLTIGDQVKLTLTGEIVAVEKRKNYNSSDSKKEQTDVRIKLLTGMAKKTGGEVMDEVDKKNQDDNATDDSKATEEEKTKKKVKNFTKMISEE